MVEHSPSSPRLGPPNYGLAEDEEATAKSGPEEAIRAGGVMEGLFGCNISIRTSESRENWYITKVFLAYYFINTEDSDILFVHLLLFPYYILEKYAVSEAAQA